MSGWIRIDKGLSESIRFKRVVRRLKESNALRNDNETLLVTACLGAIARLWNYADSHITEDSRIDATFDEIDDLVGIPGFAAALPSDWLVKIDDETVELPDFLEHNGTSAKHRSDNARRQAEWRSRQKEGGNNDTVTLRNARNDARPDQTRPDQTNTSTAGKPPTRVSRETNPEWLLDFKLAYPARAGDQGWRRAMKAANARIAEGHTPEEFIEGAKRYGAHCATLGKVGTEFVKQAATFLGPDKPFLEPWATPAKVNGSGKDPYRGAI